MCVGMHKIQQCTRVPHSQNGIRTNISKKEILCANFNFYSLCIHTNRNVTIWFLWCSCIFRKELFNKTWNTSKIRHRSREMSIHQIQTDREVYQFVWAQLALLSNCQSIKRISTLQKFVDRINCIWVRIQTIKMKSESTASLEMRTSGTKIYQDILAEP